MEAGNKYKKIMVCLDYSEEARQVALRAQELTNLYGPPLTLVHVVEPLMVDAGYDIFMDISPDLEDTRMEAAKTSLENLQKNLGLTDVEVLVEEGPVKSEILRIAKENDIDLVVIGSHGRHGISLLLGSTANAILHGAQCDVLSVRVG